MKTITPITEPFRAVDMRHGCRVTVHKINEHGVAFVTADEPVYFLPAFKGPGGIFRRENTVRIDDLWEIDCTCPDDPDYGGLVCEACQFELIGE